MLGLERGTVRLAPYAPEWPHLFEEEKERIQAAIGQHALAIEHVGSTSVPGLSAKPIIDIAVAIGDLRHVQECVAPLERLGYQYKGENGLPQRYFFSKGEPRTHHIHLVQQDSPHWHRYLLFRNHLRQNPALVRDYNDLKKHLAHQFAADRAAYTEAKTPFITSVLELAQAETKVSFS